MNIIKILLGGFVVLVGALHALADFEVNNTADSGAGSFRDAILRANSSGGGAITFPNVTGTISLVSSLPAFTQNVTATGPGAGQLTVQGAGFPIFTNVVANTVTIVGMTVALTSGGLLGSAIENFGDLTLNDCTVSGGHSVNVSAGIYNTGHLSVSNCIFSGSLGEQGSAIWNSGTLALDHCTVTNNHTYGSGCCIYNLGSLTLDYTTVAGNGYFNAGAGGAIDNPSGTVVVRNCSLTNNYAIAGGGIWNGGSLAVTNSTIAQNRATYSDGPEPGGGIFNNNGGTATLVNVTISGNTALDLGGGIMNYGTLWLLNCTIVSNSVYLSEPPDAGGGVWNAGVVNSKNTIIAGNTAPLGPDFYGVLTSQGFNLIENTSGCTIAGDPTGNLIGVNPLLGSLQTNGGPTRTHALLSGSPAIDAGTMTGAPVTDQRGIARPQGLGTDMGAYEFQYFIPQFAKTALLPGTNIWMQASCLPGTAYTLEASTNLLTWAAVTNLTADTNGVLAYTEKGIFAYRQRFYRLKTTSP